MLKGQKGKPMTEEHKAKLKAGRERFLAERQAFKPQGQIVTVIPGGNRLQKIVYKGLDHREFTVNKIAQRRQQLIDSQLDVAIGYSYVTEDGSKIYTQKPNSSTGEYLLNQLIGKPKESIEVKEEIRLSVDI
jgi:hypothetical protein